MGKGGWPPGRRARGRIALALAPVIALALALAGAPPGPDPAPALASTQARPRSVLYVWAGDAGTPDTSTTVDGHEFDAPDGDDFLAVVDADRDSATYGAILSTLSVPTPPTGNEPHHVVPWLPPGCTRLVANGLFGDTWYGFAVSDALRPRPTGTVLAAQTAGTVPQFGALLPNCEVLAAEQGGPAFEAHGTVARLAPDAGAVLEERPADRLPTDAGCASQWEPVPLTGGPEGPFVQKRDADACLPASPLGLVVRPDLATMVTSDYAAPGRLVVPAAPTADATAFTVRHYRLDPACTGTAATPTGIRCIGEPRVVVLPDGPRDEPDPRHEENVAVEGLASSHPPGALNPTGSTPPRFLPSRGAFAATTCGGALYYTPDVSEEEPRWREVFDFTTANARVAPRSAVAARCVGGGGLLVTADNRFVIASVIGREEGQTKATIGHSTDSRAFRGMIVMLDVSPLLRAGEDPRCTVDTVAEAWNGGSERDCPRIADIHVVEDPTTGGPHDLALDYPNGGGRLAFFDYFVSETGVEGDFRACMLLLRRGELVPDPAFPASVDGQPPGTGCIEFDREDWPADRGPGEGPAKPHHGLFRNT